MALYEFRQVPGRGTATFATNNIPRGTKIMEEMPILVIQRREEGSNPFSVWSHFLLRSQDEREAYLKLFPSTPNLETARTTIRNKLGDSLEKWTQDLEDIAYVTAIYWTNSFGASGHSDFDGAVYELNSRLNHNCANNMMQTAYADGSQAMEATRNITAGEELFCTYVDVDSYETRQDKLSSYGFKCACPLCAIEKYIDGTPNTKVEVSGRTVDRDELEAIVCYFQIWFQYIQLAKREDKRLKQCDLYEISINDVVPHSEVVLELLLQLLRLEDPVGDPVSYELALKNLDYWRKVVADLRGRYGSK
ncbi:SET domain-containing protein 5 [Lasiodiplodia hormozganensis]|uniref:SET domain-containing protein 5 n=1 Tax=Lasiodiplodia hormozganensis TaxID=869390 RepID=A0AA39YIY1_9PEZI|nr:SET domain-containing protein 5 [Lasiodiplodia hormozganensis]